MLWWDYSNKRPPFGNVYFFFPLLLFCLQFGLHIEVEKSRHVKKWGHVEVGGGGGGGVGG